MFYFHANDEDKTFSTLEDALKEIKENYDWVKKVRHTNGDEYFV